MGDFVVSQSKRQPDAPKFSAVVTYVEGEDEMPFCLVYGRTELELSLRATLVCDAINKTRTKALGGINDQGHGTPAELG